MNNNRHLTIFNSEMFKDREIHIFGCGNVGSHAAEAVVRMGFENIHLYDYDDVEGVNLSTQNFTDYDKGNTKLLALTNRLTNINPDMVIQSHHTKIDAQSTLTYADDTLCTICGFDSIEARVVLQKLLEQQHPNTPIIDGRLGREQVEVLFARVASSWDTSDEDIIELACTEKYISYTPLLVASLIGHDVKLLAKGEDIIPHKLFDFTTNSYLTLTQ